MVPGSFVLHVMSILPVSPIPYLPLVLPVYLPCTSPPASIRPASPVPELGYVVEPLLTELGVPLEPLLALFQAELGVSAVLGLAALEGHLHVRDQLQAVILELLQLLAALGQLALHQRYLDRRRAQAQSDRGSQRSDRGHGHLDRRRAQPSLTGDTELRQVTCTSIGAEPGPSLTGGHRAVRQGSQALGRRDPTPPSLA